MDFRCVAIDHKHHRYVGSRLVELWSDYWRNQSYSAMPSFATVEPLEGLIASSRYQEA